MTKFELFAPGVGGTLSLACSILVSDNCACPVMGAATLARQDGVHASGTDRVSREACGKEVKPNGWHGKRFGRSGAAASGSDTGRDKPRSPDWIEELIVDPPFGKLADPTVTTFSETDAIEVVVGQGPGDLTWEQRVLRLLSDLTVAKGFKELRPELRDEVQSLIDTAPESAKL